MSDLFGIFGEDIEVVKPTQFEKLPKGKYECSLNKVTERERNGSVSLSLEFGVLTGEYENRKLWINLTMSSDNEKLSWLVKRDKGHLRTLAEICGFTADKPMESFDDLLDLPVMVDIGYRNDYVQLNFFSKVETSNAGSEAEWTVF
jgi:hypothetical protein